MTLFAHGVRSPLGFTELAGVFAVMLVYFAAHIRGHPGVDALERRRISTAPHDSLNGGRQ
ncbi:MAG TPA: hypothetical protein VMM36_02105 [Opitutaceae bacterium]|nr:hypothetical protein [Opitutaceae bacterium]